jgi:hypothetical protein
MPLPLEPVKGFYYFILVSISVDKGNFQDTVFLNEIISRLNLIKDEALIKVSAQPHHIVRLSTL